MPFICKQTTPLSWYYASAVHKFTVGIFLFTWVNSTPVRKWQFSLLLQKVFRHQSIWALAVLVHQAKKSVSCIKRETRKHREAIDGEISGYKKDGRQRRKFNFSNETCTTLFLYCYLLILLSAIGEQKLNSVSKILFRTRSLKEANRILGLLTRVSNGLVSW